MVCHGNEIPTCTVGISNYPHVGHKILTETNGMKWALKGETRYKYIHHIVRS